MGQDGMGGVQVDILLLLLLLLLLPFLLPSYMLWNPDTGEVLTRTPLSWLKITAFYCVYYTCLAGFWIACLNIFFQTLPETVDGPRWTQGDSIIGVNPGKLGVLKTDQIGLNLFGKLVYFCLVGWL